MTDAKSGPAAPKSLINRSFTNLADVKDQVLNEDYVHSTFETWKIKGKTSGSGKWDFKAKVKDYKSGVDDELKIQFPFSRYWFWVGLRRKGDLKVHVDVGDITLAGKSLNLFSNIKTNNKFSSFQFRFGANYFGNNYESNTRLETNPDTGKGYWLTQRNFVRKAKFFYGLVGSVSLTDFSFTRYDAILGYNKDAFNLYFKFEGTPAKDGAKTQLVHGVPAGKFTVTGVYSKDKSVFGAELVHDAKGNEFQVATQRELNDKSTVKAKLNQNLDLSFVWKYKWNQTLNITSAAQLQLKKGSNAVDFNNFTPVPFGVQFELNI